MTAKAAQVVTKRKIVRDLEKCALCGLCSYKCPPNAIKFMTAAPGICTECGLCVEVCPIKAVDPKTGTFKPSCTKCMRCLRECPVGAIYVEGDHLAIRKGDPQAFIVNCTLCTLCVQNCPRGALVYDGIRIKFNPEKCDGCGRCEEVCPVGTIKVIKEQQSVIGWCMFCGYCVRICPTKALSIKTVQWDGSISDSCIRCGVCVSVCPTKAIRFDPITMGKPQVDLSKCILCELCASHCPVNAIPILQTLPKREFLGGRITIHEDQCVGCGLCETACLNVNKEFTAIKVEGYVVEENGVKKGGVAKVDLEKCTKCGACATICPADCIKVVRIYDDSKVSGIAEKVVMIP